MMVRYEALSVPVFRFHYEGDLHGTVVPPECYCDGLNDGRRIVPVCFNDDLRTPVGKATLRRQGRWIIADIQIVSPVRPISAAIELIRKLTPTIGFVVRDSYGSIVTMIQVSHVSLMPFRNLDAKIQPLGKSVSCLSKEMLD